MHWLLRNLRTDVARWVSVWSKCTRCFASEINSIHAVECGFDLHFTSVRIDIPIFTSTSHFFQTSRPQLGITGMQFPVNNIPRPESPSLAENSSFPSPPCYTPRSPSPASFLLAYPPKHQVTHFSLCLCVNGLLIPLPLAEFFKLIMKGGRPFILVTFQY